MKCRSLFLAIPTVEQSIAFEQEWHLWRNIQDSIEAIVEHRCDHAIDLINVKCHYLRSLDPWSKEPQKTFEEWVTARMQQMILQQVTDLLPYIDQGFKDAEFNHAHLIIDQGVSVKSPSNEIIRHDLSW